MRRWCMPLALLTTMIVITPRAIGQDMTFDLDEAEASQEAGADAEAGTDAEAGADAEASAEGDLNIDVIDELATSGTDTTTVKTTKSRATEAVEEIYAVQQIYALRNRRLELAPSLGFTVNDPYVSHPSVGVALNYWWTNVLAVGGSFLWYQGLENESDLNFFARRSTRLAVPITEYQLGAHLNFSYVPLYGKFSMFNKYIFQWDAYVVGGLGALRTRPVPVVDPEIRQFDFDWRLAFNAGVGLRVFLTRYFAVFTELRDYAFLERLESTNVALGSARENKDTWLADSPSLTNNVTVHLGVTLFFPFEFEYKLPK